LDLVPARLFGGTALMAALYVAVGPLAGSSTTLASALLEGALFAGVVLWAHGSRRPRVMLGFALSAAVANALTIAAWPWALSLPVLASQALSLPDAVARFVGFGFYSAVGAVIFCLLIDAFLRPRYFSLRTYGLTALCCVGAGLPCALADEPVVAVHKAAWWLLFSVGLWWAGRGTPRGSGAAPGSAAMALLVLVALPMPMLLWGLRWDAPAVLQPAAFGFPCVPLAH